MSVIIRFLSSLLPVSQQDPDGATVLSDHALGLIGTALGIAAGVGLPEPDARELARVRVLEYMHANFVDQEFGPTRLRTPATCRAARCSGCSPTRRSRSLTSYAGCG
jgi:hypothetical protein